MNKKMLILSKGGKPLGVREVTITRDAMVCEGVDDTGKPVIYLLEKANKSAVVEGA